MLLCSDTLVARDGLAAIRFDVPVAPSAIALNPSGSSPFQCAPELVASTDPGHLLLKLFFNAQRVSGHSNSKAKPSNALLSTNLAYTGGQRSYPIPWNEQVNMHH